MILLVTGGRGTGKSTLCRHLVRELAGRGLHPGGILGPGIFDKSGRKIGFYAESAASGERRLLAETRAPAPGGPARGPAEESASPLPSPGGSGSPEDLGPRTGRFLFSAGAFAWAGETLRRDAAEGRNPIFIDEIGPLEIEKKGGFYPALAEIQKNPPPFLVLVVRAELKEAARRLLGGDFRAFDLGPAGGKNAAESIAADIVSLIEAAAAGAAPNPRGLNKKSLPPRGGKTFRRS